MDGRIGRKEANWTISLVQVINLTDSIAVEKRLLCKLQSTEFSEREKEESKIRKHECQQILPLFPTFLGQWQHFSPLLCVFYIMYYV